MNGYSFLANKDVEVICDNLKTSLNVGDFVRFKATFLNGRINKLQKINEVDANFHENFRTDVGKWITDEKEYQRMLERENGRNQNEEKITKKYIWQILVVLLITGYWISKGTPNPSLFFATNTAKNECLKLANENLDSLLFSGTGKIEARKSWLKGGKRVVQLIQENDKNIRQIMCVYGNGVVQIPSLFEQGRWR